MEYMRSQFTTAQSILNEAYGSNGDQYLNEYSSGLSSNIDQLNQNLKNASVNNLAENANR